MLKTVAIDIETTGLYPVPGSKIFCCAVNDLKSIQVHTNIESLRGLLEDKNVVKIIHNAAFDAFWLLRLHNIRVRNIWDTKLIEQVILGENLPRNAKVPEELKMELSSSLAYTLPRYGLSEIETAGKKRMQLNFASRPKDKPLTKEEIDYAKDDVRYLHQLQAMQERRLTRLGLMRVANLENSLVEVVVDMRNRGIGFDKSIWLRIARQKEQAFNSILKRLPPQVENWNSPQQVKKYFNSIGIPLESITDAEEIQKTYNNPVLGKFVELRSYYKAVTSYGVSWLQDDIKGNTVDVDGRIRSDFEQIINSGRFASSHPNMQQNDEEHREAFVPAKGCVFVIADYESQEIGIAAAGAKEDRWIKAILRGDDIHSMTASIVLATDWQNGYEPNCTFPKKCECKIHKAKRQVAKVTNFTILYGGGVFNIAGKTGIARKEAEKIVYKFKKSVPKLTRWLSKNADSAIKTRLSFSADPFKRRRTLRDPEDWMLANIGKNNPIQSCGANMLKLAMVSLNRDNCPLVHTEHDALVIEVPKSKAKAAAKELKAVMEKAADYCTGIPGLIKVNPYISHNLQKKHEKPKENKTNSTGTRTRRSTGVKVSTRRKTKKV